MSESERICLQWGRYEGYWTAEDNTSKYEVVVDEANFEPLAVEPMDGDSHTRAFFEGFLEWRVVETTGVSPTLAHLNTQGIEIVRGYFEADTKKWTCTGYKVAETLPRMLGVASYLCFLNSKTVALRTFGWRKKWLSNMEMKRVASKRELRELIADKFEERNIVNIVADLLHFIDTSQMAECNSQGERYLTQMLKGVGDANLKRLFHDVSYYKPDKSKPARFSGFRWQRL